MVSGKWERKGKGEGRISVVEGVNHVQQGLPWFPGCGGGRESNGESVVC